MGKGGEIMTSSLKKLIPNVLTGFRLIVGINIFLLVFYKEDFYQIAGLMLICALITDFLDGFLARKLNAATQFGYFFDHSVDFILIPLMLYLALKHLSFCLAISYLVLEIGVVIISLIRLIIKDKTLWPNVFGRLSFGFLGVSVCVLLLFLPLPSWIYFCYLANVFLAIAVLLRLLSILVFLSNFKKEVRK